MQRDIRFEKRTVVNPTTYRKADEVVVIRDGHEVAVLPDASRLDRALSLPVEEVARVAHHFAEIMKREPTTAEREFWSAVVDYKHSHPDGDADTIRASG